MHKKAMEEKERIDKKEKSEKEKNKELEQKENSEKEEVELQESISIKKESSSYGLTFDWKKGNVVNASSADGYTASNDILSYKQNSKPLDQLLGLVVDMIGRGVDDLKIAQTIMYRNNSMSSECEILQTIASIKDFIAFAVNGKFNEIKKAKNLPDEETALYHLSEGDSTYALALMEALMDSNIEKSSKFTSGPKRDELFIETANQACVFGNLAAIKDTHLATGAFELSIELSPHNVNAWNRVGDMYRKAGSNKQAIWAYNNVKNIADEEINAEALANTNKQLSQYNYEQGNNLQAAKLYNESKQYYDNLGINRRLDRQEIEIVEIIESRQKSELSETISKILNNKDLRFYSYA